MAFDFKTLLRDSLKKSRRILWENLSEKYYPNEFKDIYPDKESVYSEIYDKVSLREYIPFILKNSDTHDPKELVELVNYYHILIRSGVVDKFIKQTKTRLDIKDINSWKNVDSFKSFLKSLASFSQEVEINSKVSGGMVVYEDKSSVVVFMSSSQILIDGENIEASKAAFGDYLKLGKMVYVIADRLHTGFKKTFVIVNIDGTYENSLLESVAVEWKNKKITNAIDTHHKNELNKWINIHEGEVKWKTISFSETLPEEFIEAFQNKVDWKNISCKQKLSEPFIEKHQHSVDWREIAKCQTLSAEFLYKHQKLLPWNLVSLNPNVSDEIKEKYRKAVAVGKSLHSSVMQNKVGNKFVKKN